MPIATGDKEYQLPVGGLNTEANLLNFPQEFSVDLLNMEIDYNPQVIRPRKGVLRTSLPSLLDTRAFGDQDFAISVFLWEGVGGDASLDLIVVQVAEFLYFYTASLIDNVPAVSGIHSERFDLTDVLSGTSLGTAAAMETTRVVMENVKGNLMVTAEPINPILIQWDASAPSITVTELNLKVRDIIGIEDGLLIDEHPSTLSDDHKYNLLNQGWYKQRRLTSGSTTESDPITEYNTVWSEYPSNADIVWLGMVEDAGDLIFDAEWLRDQTFGSTPAPRGHYVVDAFNIDRDAILTDPTQSGQTSGGSSGSGGGGGLKPGDGTDRPGGALP